MKAASGKARWVGRRLAPLRQRLRRGSETPRTALARIVGAEHAERIVSGLERARMASAAVPHEAKKLRDGRVVHTRFAARVRLDANRLRTEQCPEVVGPVMLLTHVLEQVRPGQRRAWTRGLWLGRPAEAAAHAGGLASQLGVCVRTLQRWFAALRSLGVLKNWQPPADKAPAWARTRKGRAYSLYEIPDFGPTWADWQGSLKPEVQSAVHGALPATDGVPPRKGSDGSVASFMALIPPLPD